MSKGEVWIQDRGLSLRMTYMFLDRKWCECQEEEVWHWDEASTAKKQKTIQDTEKVVNDFYKEYNLKAECNIK